MYKIFLKIAARYLLKNKLYSFINIGGLAIGVASFILIMLYVNYERSYDKFEGSDSVYRVYMEYTEGGVFAPGDAQTFNLSGPTLKKEFPEVIEQVRLSQMGKITFQYNNTILEEENGFVADDSYFDIFKYPLLTGEANEVLKEPYSVVLTQSLSDKIFRNEDPVGKTLSVFYARTEAQFKVTGILMDIPRNTHMNTNFLISFNSINTWAAYEGMQDLNWMANDFFTYLKLDSKTDIELLQEKIIKQDFLNDKDKRHNIEPLEDIHLYSNKPYEAEVNGSVNRIKFLMAISLVILLLSWLNYVNLATAKSLERAKEIGVRKVAGAQKPQLILQSLSESLLLNVLALVFAIFIVVLILPLFRQYIGQELLFGITSLKSLWPILAVVILGAIVSGIYPAFILINYTPSQALKGNIQNSMKGFFVRKGLITIQFLATIVLLVGTIVVSKQIKYLKEQPIGVNLNQVLALEGDIVGDESKTLGNGFRSLEAELKKLSFVEDFTTASSYPGEGYNSLSSSNYIEYPDGRIDKNTVHHTFVAGKDYFELMSMEFLAGQPFIGNDNLESTEIVVNKKFVQTMGLTNPEDAVGKRVKFWGAERKIMGVLDDYHHFGLKNAIAPMIIRQGYVFDKQLVKLNVNANSISGFENAITQIQAVWKSVFPESTFNYTFLDKKFQSQYMEETKFGTAFQIFTTLAILIASLGLFGLTAYTVVQRKKEIGIRKVNGATIAQILALLNKDFVKWVGIAFIAAVPISWYAMNKWLESFAYKTTMNWWIFALAGIMALLIALLSVSWQSFGAAVANPVDALRDE